MKTFKPETPTFWRAVYSRVGPHSQKLSDQKITPDPTGSIVLTQYIRGNEFVPPKKILIRGFAF